MQMQSTFKSQSEGYLDDWRRLMVQIIPEIVSQDNFDSVSRHSGFMPSPPHSFSSSTSPLLSDDTQCDEQLEDQQVEEGKQEVLSS